MAWELWAYKITSEHAFLVGSFTSRAQAEQRANSFHGAWEHYPNRSTMIPLSQIARFELIEVDD